MVCGLWSVVCGLWSVSIDSHVQYISFSLFTYCRTMMAFQRTERRQWGGTVYWRQYIVAFTDVFLLTQYLLCKYCTVLISVDSNERKYCAVLTCAVLTSVDSTDILCVSRILYSTLQSYIMSLLRKYCTVHYLYCKFCTVHYSGAVHKYCAILTSVDSTDILCSTDISRQ